MDGSILGYDEAADEGAIRTEDGKRFSFKRAEWKGERLPKVGDKVDFVADGDTATQIYLLKGSFSGPDLSGIGDKLGDADSRAEMLAAVRSNATVGMFLTKPHVAGAGLIILGWLLAGHLLLIFRVGEIFDAMGQINQMARAFGGDTGIGLFRSIGILSLLAFYLIPIFAGWLIYKSMSNSETAKNKRQAALSGLVLPILVPIIAFIFIFIGLPGQMREAILEGAGQASRSGLSLWDLIDVDFPWFLMIAGGVLILLQMMGVIKSFSNDR